MNQIQQVEDLTYLNKDILHDGYKSYKKRLPQQHFKNIAIDRGRCLRIIPGGAGEEPRVMA